MELKCPKCGWRDDDETERMADDNNPDDDQLYFCTDCRSECSWEDRE